MNGDTSALSPCHNRTENGTVVTPRPWPENAVPTAEQFADWFVAATREERVNVAAGLLDSASVANRCVIQNHDGLMVEVTYARAAVVRYRTAWLSARRRIHPHNFLRGWRRFSEEQSG